MADVATDKVTLHAKDSSNVLLAEVMTALKSDFSKLDRDGNGKITKDELKQDQTDQKLSGQDRAAATWLSNHYDDVANINYGWPWTTRIAKKDTDAVVSLYTPFATDLSRCQKLEQMLPVLFQNKSQLSMVDLDAAKTNFKDPDALQTIDWAKDHMNTIGTVTSTPHTSIIPIGKSSMIMTTGSFSYALSADNVRKSEQKIKELDSYSLFK